MSTVVKCDMCGEEIAHERDRVRLLIGRRRLHFRHYDGYDISCDLCRKCANIINSVVQGKARMGQEGEQ